MEQEIKQKRTRVVNIDQIEIAEPQTAPTIPSQTRVYGQQTQKIHDLYKLAVAPMLKNTAQDGTVPNYVNAEHCHFFHTFTSDGLAQNTSSTIGGHFHVMEVVTPADGETPAVYKCSPPMRWAIVKDKYKRKSRQMILANDEDLHTHEVEYIRSEMMKLRQKNMEAAAFHAQIMAKQDKTVPGVQ